MDALAGQIAQGLVDHPLSFDARTPGKNIGNYIHSEMTFARTIIAAVAAMFAAVVDDCQK